ncbi:MAG: LA_2272 family surface repeat-containing protein [Polyangiales bacterium]
MRHLAVAIAIVAPLVATLAAAEENDARIVLAVDALDGVDPEALREAIAAELGVDVALAAPGIAGRGTLSVRGEGKDVVVTFTREGKSVSRTIARPGKTATAIEMIALLSGNLVRDEASGLIDELRKKAPPAPSPSPSVAPKPPPPAPAKEEPPAPPGPCDLMADHWWWGVDLAPGAGMSSVERGRGVRALSFGAAGTLTTAVRGIDVAGGVAVARRAMCGVQLAGGAAIVMGTVRGVQVAGGVNIAGAVDGAQLSTVNIAQGDIRGVQLGVVNVSTGDVRGFQLGVVNVAKDGDAALGLVSIYGNGRTNFDVTMMDVSGGLFSVEHGGRVLHNIYGLATRKSDAGNHLMLTFGLGARVAKSEVVTFDIDLLHHWLVTSPDSPYTSLEQLRALFGLKLWTGFSVIAGPTWSVLVTKNPQESASGIIAATNLTHEGSTTRVIGWPGITFGVRVL